MCLSSESCIYYRWNKQGIVIAVVHIDDFLSIANSEEENACFEAQMKTKWITSSLGEPKFCIEIAIKCNRADRTVSLSQTTLIDKIITQFGQSKSHPISTPMDPGLKLQQPVPNSITPLECKKLSKIPYRSLVGCLIYLAVGTHFDISYAVQQLSQLLDCYTHAHWNAAIHAVQYLKGMRNLTLTLGGETDLRLMGYTDSDWANCLDTRRSVGGFGFTLGSGLISWNAKKTEDHCKLVMWGRIHSCVRGLQGGNLAAYPFNRTKIHTPIHIYNNSLRQQSHNFSIIQSCHAFAHQTYWHPIPLPMRASTEQRISAHLH